MLEEILYDLSTKEDLAEVEEISSRVNNFRENSPNRAKSENRYERLFRPLVYFTGGIFTGAFHDGDNLFSYERIFVSEAVMIAHSLFRGEKRKIGENPLVKHGIDTAHILSKHNHTGIINHVDVASAIFHDLFEDVPTIAGHDLRNCLEYNLGYSLGMLSGKAGNVPSAEAVNQDISRVIRNVERLTHNGLKDGLDYDKYLLGVFLDPACGRIKIADKIAQSFEMDESTYFNWKAKAFDWLKHQVLKHVREENVQRLSRINNPVIKRIYDYMEHAKIPGSMICGSAFKDFRIVDLSCNYLNNANEPDYVMASLKDGLIRSSLDRVIRPRKRHLVQGHHVSKEYADYVREFVDKYEKAGRLFRYTVDGPRFDDIGNDVIAVYYRNLMMGYKGQLKTLDAYKNNQYKHLALFERLMERYEKDIGKSSGLFVFSGYEQAMK